MLQAEIIQKQAEPVQKQADTQQQVKQELLVPIVKETIVQKQPEEPKKSKKPVIEHRIMTAERIENSTRKQPTQQETIIKQPITKKAENKPVVIPQEEETIIIPEAPPMVEVMQLKHDIEPEEVIYQEFVDINESVQAMPEVNMTEAEVINYELLSTEFPFLIIAEILNVTDEVEVADEIPPVLEQLQTFAETLEPAKATESLAIMDIMMEKIVLLSDEDTILGPEQVEQLEQELEILCERLLVCMGVEPKPETVKQLILVLKNEYLEQIEETKQDYDEGTHEFKQTMSNVMHGLQDTLHPSMPWLGRYALRLTRLAA